MHFCQHADDDNKDEDGPVLRALKHPSLMHQDKLNDPLPPPQLYNKRTSRGGGDIDTTPGTDPVENFRPRHFSADQQQPRGRGLFQQVSHPTVSLPKVTAKQEVHGNDVDEDGNRDDIFDKSVAMKTNSYSQAVGTEKQEKSPARADTIANKFCGISFPTTKSDLDVADLAICCDGMYIRDKLKCWYGASTSRTHEKIYKSLSYENATCSVDNDTIENDSDGNDKDDVSSLNDCSKNLTEKHSERLPDVYYAVNKANENEESTVTSTGSEDTSHTAVSKSPRRLRLARLHKQRLQQPQHRVTNHSLSIP